MTDRTARSGMSTLIEELRGMTEAGMTDYKIGDTYYWTDDQVQNMLDNHRNDIVFEQLQMYPYQIVGGSLSYQDYRSACGFTRPPPAARPSFMFRIRPARQLARQTIQQITAAALSISRATRRGRSTT